MSFKVALLQALCPGFHWPQIELNHGDPGIYGWEALILGKTVRAFQTYTCWKGLPLSIFRAKTKSVALDPKILIQIME